MVRKIMCAAFLCGISVLHTYGNEVNDTISDRKFGEVVVTAKKSEIIAPGIIKLTPMPMQKRLASTAAQLLANMNMAMFKINETEQTINLADGQGVALFINGRAATKEELKGLRPTSVRYLLVLDNPEDPKYGGAQHVIDYILKDEVGGYAKISVSETFLNGSETDGDIYTKFNDGKLTYSFFANGWQKATRHGGADEKEVFNLMSDPPCYPVTINRVTEISDYKKDSWSVPLTGKLSYSSKKFMMDQTIGYSHDSYPSTLKEAGFRKFNEGNDGNYEESRKAQSNNVKWNGWYYFIFPRSFSLSVSTVVDHSHNKSLSTFDGAWTSFENKAKENSYIYMVSANASKRFGSKHSLRLDSYFMYTRSVIDYFTDNANTVYRHPSYDATLTYSFMLPSFNLSVFGGINHSTTNTNGVRTKRNTPATGASFGLKTGKKGYLSGYFQYKTGGTGASAYNSEVLRWDEIKYFTGDPNITTERRMLAGLSWSWNPSNKFSLYPYVSYSEIFDRITLVYSPYASGVLMQWQNVGNYKRLESGVNASYSLLNGKLSLNANPKALDFFSLGTDTKSYSAFAMDLGAMYMSGNFRFTANWATIQKALGTDGEKNRLPSRFDIGASWFKGAWSISMKLANLFRSNWKAGSSSLVTHYYEYNRVDLGTDYHRACMLSATYTFDYGKKKVDHSQDVRREAYRNSAILKK